MANLDYLLEFENKQIIKKHAESNPGEWRLLSYSEIKPATMQISIETPVSVPFT